MELSHGPDGSDLRVPTTLRLGWRHRTRSESAKRVGSADTPLMSLEDRLYPLLKLYDSLPRGLKGALGVTYRHLPTAWRWGKHYPEFKKLALEGEHWSQEEIRAYQLKELRRTLHHAASDCRFYQRRFAQAGFRPESVHNWDDLKHCPLLEKQDLLEHTEEMVHTTLPTN